MEKIIAGKLYLDSLGTGIPATSPGKALLLMETCVWCLLKQNHANGVKLKVVENDVENGEKGIFFEVYWPKYLNIEAIFRSYNQEDATQFGAEAIAILLVREYTKFTVIERAVTSTGIDYWLGIKNTNKNHIFHRAARLEISGILAENPSNTVTSRINIKLKQTQPTAHTFPVYIIVTEFSKPWVKMVLKNVNR